MPRCKVAVIGAGIVGGSVAFHLTQYGADVTVFDKGSPGAGATSHSFAWLNAFGKLPRHYFALNQRSMELWSRFGEELGDGIGLRWGGNVTYFADKENGERLLKQCAQLQSWGYPARSITKEELSELEPNLNVGPFHSAVYTMNEGHVIAQKVAEVCMEKVKSSGGKVYLNTNVDSIMIRKGNVVLDIGQGEIAFDKVVIAAGINSTVLAKTVGIFIPQRNSPGVIARTSKLPAIIKNLSTIYLPPANEREAEIHIRQDIEGVITIGAGNQENESKDDSQEYADLLIKRASSFFNQLTNIPAVRVPVGFRPMPKDGLPVIGFSSEASNIYITLMHSGATLAPIAGSLAALEIVTETEIDYLSPYRPSRFSQRPHVSSQ